MSSLCTCVYCVCMCVCTCVTCIVHVLYICVGVYVSPCLTIVTFTLCLLVSASLFDSFSCVIPLLHFLYRGHNTKGLYRR